MTIDSGTKNQIQMEGHFILNICMLFLNVIKWIKIFLIIAVMYEALNPLESNESHFFQLIL